MKRGRKPIGEQALTPAEKQRRYRERKKQEAAARKDPTRPLTSKLIDLSALPAWKRG